MIRDCKQTGIQRLNYNTTHTHNTHTLLAGSSPTHSVTSVSHRYTRTHTHAGRQLLKLETLPPNRIITCSCYFLLYVSTHKHTPLTIETHTHVLRAYRSQRSRFITPDSLSVHEGATLSSEPQKERKESPQVMEKWKINRFQGGHRRTRNGSES